MNPQIQTAKNMPAQWDPFPEPHTMPTGWDLSEFLNAPKKTTLSISDSAGED
jgi:hypothetical protein